jgi:hypothetical protein
MKQLKDAAFVVSVHEDVFPGTLRINLKWPGNHDIYDFDLGQLGNVVNCAAETENTGWVIVERSRLVTPGEVILLR